MDDKDLAGRIVALGVGGSANAPYLYYIGSAGMYEAHEFVRDWRVAGALLSEAEGTMNAEDFYHAMLPLFHEAEISNPRAICGACVAALEDK